MFERSYLELSREQVLGILVLQVDLGREVVDFDRRRSLATKSEFIV